MDSTRIKNSANGLRQIALFCLWSATAAVWVAPCAATPEPAESESDTGVEEIQNPFGESEEDGADAEAAAGAPIESIDQCDWTLENQELQEQTREIARSWSCHTFRWFDS